MARRINKPVLFGLLAVVVVAVVVVVVFFWVAKSGHQVEEHKAKLAAAREKGDSEVELFELQVLLGLDPENLVWREDYARLLEEKGELGKAFSEWRILADKAPEHLGARLKVSEYSMMTGKHTEAGRQASEVVRRSPDNAKAHLLLARSFLARRLLPEAEVEAEKVMELEPTNVQGYITKAQVLRARGDWEKTLEVITAGMKAVPNDPVMQTFAGDFYSGRNEFEKAETAYEAACSVSENKVSPLLRLSGLYSAKGMNEKAETKLVEAVKVAEEAGDRLSVRRAYGRFLARLGRNEEALEQYRLALEVMPKHALLLSERAEILLTAGKLDSQAGAVNAEGDINAILERGMHDEHKVQALYLQGRLYMNKGRVDDAIRSFERAAEENSGVPKPISMTNTSLSLGVCYERKGETGKASALLAKTLERDPNDWRVRYALGRVMVKRGEHGKAVNILIGRRLPMDGALLLARAQANGGDHASARRTLQSVLKQKPDNMRARQEMMRVEYLARKYRRVIELADAALAEDIPKTGAERMDVYTAKIESLKSLERYADTERVYRELASSYPDWYVMTRRYALFLLSRDRFVEGEQLLKNLAKQSKNKRVTDSYLAGYYLLARKMDEARAEYRRLAGEYPDSSMVRMQLVHLAISTKDFAEAEKYLGELSQSQAASPEVKILRARILMGRDKVNEAVSILSDVVSKTPNHVLARYYLAVAQVDLGQLTQAIGHLEAVASMSPRMRRVRELLATLYFDVGRLDDSKKMLQAVKTLGGENLSPQEKARLDRLDALQDVLLGRPAEAEIKLRVYLKDHPDEGRSWLALGDALFALAVEAEGADKKTEAETKKVEAEKAYLKAWEKNYRNRQALFTITRFYLLTEKPDKAIRIAEEATGQTGALRGDVASLALLARLYERSNHQADADRAYDAIGKIDPGNVLQLLSQADRQSKAGQHAEAVALLEQTLVRRPRDLNIRRQLVGELVKLRRYDRALGTVEESLGAASDASVVLSLNDLKASVLVNARRLSEAETLLKKAIEDATRAGLQIETVGARFRLAGIQNMRGDMDAAMAELRQVTRLQPKLIDARVELMRLYTRQGRYPEARLEALTALNERPVLSAYLTLGDIALNTGSVDEAVKQYRLATEEFPDSGLPRRGLGVAYLKQKQTAKALDVFREALVLSKYVFSELRVMVYALVQSEKHDEAIRLLTEVGEKVGLKGGAQFLMGEVETNRADHAKAVAHYEEASKANPTHAGFVLTLAQSRLAMKDYAGVERLAEGILTGNARSQPAYELLLKIYEITEDVAKQERVYERWLKVTPNSVAAVNNYAYFLARHDRAREALKQMEGLKRRAKDSPEYQFYLSQLLDTEGWIQHELKDYARARGLLEQARQLRPKSPDVLNHLRLVYLKLRDEAKGRGEDALARAYEKEAGLAMRDLMEVRIGDPGMQINLARVYMVEGKLDEAVKCLRQTLAMSENLRARKALVETLIRGARLDDAEKDLAVLKSQAPDDEMTSVLEVMLLTKRALMLSRPTITPKATEYLSQAQTLLTRTLAKHPDSGMVHFVQADVYLRQGKLDDAERSLAETVRLSPDFLDAYLLRAQVLAARNRLDEATTSCDEVLKRSPRNYQAHLMLGNLLLNQNKSDDAEKRFRIMLTTFPDSASVHERLAHTLMTLGRTDEALRQYQEARRLQPNDFTLLQTVVGLQARKGQAVKALQEVKTYLEENRMASHAYVLQGQLNDRLEKFGDAEESFRRAIQYGPNNPDGYVNLAEYYVRQKRHKLALAQTQKMLDANVDRAHAWRLKGRCYETMGDRAKATESYRAGLKEFPTDALGANNLAWLLLQRRSDIDEAIRVGEVGVKAQPNFWPLLDTLGYAYLAKGDSVKASATLEQAVKLMSAERRISADVLLHSGMALLKLGKTELGVTRVREALKHNRNLVLPDWVKEIVQRQP